MKIILILYSVYFVTTYKTTSFKFCYIYSYVTNHDTPPLFKAKGCYSEAKPSNRCTKSITHTRTLVTRGLYPLWYFADLLCLAASDTK